MSAINPNDLAKFAGVLEVRPAGTSDVFTRLASVRGLIANIDISNIIEVKADDTGTVYKATNQETNIEAELLESMGRDTIELLFNGTASDIAGSSTPITGEALGTGWTIGQPIKLANKNGANTIVTSIVIDADGTPLTLGTDYNTYVGDGNNGDLGFTYIVPITTQTGVLDADYDYTPNVTESFSTTNSTQELKNFEVRITATDGVNNRITTISSAAFSGVYGMSYVDIVEAGDITGSTLTFTSNKGSTTLYENSII